MDARDKFEEGLYEAHTHLGAALIHDECNSVKMDVMISEHVMKAISEIQVLYRALRKGDVEIKGDLK